MEGGEATPILEFHYTSPECNTAPDSIYQWRDVADSESLATAEYSPDFCGYAAVGIQVDAESCCRTSLDLSLTEGYSSLGTSLDLATFPKTAQNKHYCLLENSTEVYGYEKAYFAGNGACFGEFRCFSANKSLLVYAEKKCVGDAEVFSLGDTPVSVGADLMLLASFISIAPSTASIEYAWTTYFPNALYAQSPDYIFDTVSRIFNVSAILLPLIFFSWHIRQYLHKMQPTILFFCVLHLILTASASFAISLANITLEPNDESFKLSCRLLSASISLNSISHLFAMIVNTMVVFQLVLRDIKIQYKVMAYIAVVLQHFAISAPEYLWYSICVAEELLPYQQVLVKWHVGAEGYMPFVMYVYDTLCVICVTVYLYSMDKKFKNSKQKNSDALRQTFLDTGCRFAFFAQLAVLFSRIIIVIFLRVKSWPGSDKKYDAVLAFCDFLLALHCCLSSWSYFHYASIFRKVMHKKKPESKLKMKALFDAKSSFLGVLRKFKFSGNMISRKTYNNSKNNLQSSKLVSDGNLIPSPKFVPKSPDEGSLIAVHSGDVNDEKLLKKSQEIADLDTVKIPKKD